MLGVGEILVCCLAAIYLLFKLLPFVLAVAVVVVAIGAIYFKFERKHSFWQRKGVNGPQGNFFVGVTFLHGKGQHLLDIEWSKQYGKTYGYELLGHQCLAVTDLDTLKKVLVKDFPDFTNRTQFLPRNAKTKLSLLHDSLIVKTDDDWRNVRNTITPAFTSGKMKSMIPTMDSCAKIFCEVIGEYADKQEKIPLKEVCGKVTIDVISRTALGIESNVQRDENEPILEHAKKIFGTQGVSFRVFLITLFPTIVLQLQELFGRLLIHHDTHQFFIETLSDLLERRLHESEKSESVDFLQLLLSSIQEDETLYSTEDSDIVHKEISEVKDGKKKLTKFEILAQAFLFLLAGYETTATTLHFILYMLAHHTEVQQRCRDEIAEIVGDSEVAYEHITKLKYIDQVISETLRMFPPTVRTGRECNAPTEIEGIPLEKGTSVIVPIYTIHHDEKHYPNPEIFDPNRFSAEEKAKRDPLTFLPFGFGPRNCIGLRFAQFELRVILVEALRRFAFTPTNTDEKMPPELDTRGLTKPMETLYVNVERN
ncbi:hypothetical protein QR680_017960 [Steinernema hermaphroditum]|uniref:Cytochrome P450 n=1 Tax=Steinernema hermaphroditum TaxID=289476 RepID=A0AA39HIM5_9BILA|nr:hypothetical protein QR680_017960 [Steinernema hermaphroditum]